MERFGEGRSGGEGSGALTPPPLYTTYDVQISRGRVPELKVSGVPRGSQIWVRQDRRIPENSWNFTKIT